MIRPAVLIWLTLIAIASAVVFVTGRQVDALETELHRVNRAIVTESEAIRVLRTEWSYLNRPDRLRTLASELTALEPANGGQIILATGVIPYPLPQPGEVLTIAATRIPGFQQLPMPARHPNLGPMPPEPTNGRAIGREQAGPDLQSPELVIPAPAAVSVISTERSDPIGALLAGLDVSGDQVSGGSVE